MYKILDLKYKVKGELSSKVELEPGTIKYSLGYIDYNFLSRATKRVIGNLINVKLSFYIEEPTDEGYRLYEVSSIDFANTTNQGINIGIKDLIVKLGSYRDSNLPWEID